MPLLPLALLLLVPLPQQARSAPPGLRVLAHVPVQNELDVPRASEVRVRFSQPIDADSLDATSFQVLGRWSGVRTGTFHVSEAGRVVRFVPASPFSAGELVTVSLARTLRSTLGAPLARGYAWSFWAGSRAGNGTYTQTGTLFPGQTPYGVYGGDLDGDGDLDLAVPNEDSSDVSVYLNQGGGSFGAEVAYPVGFHCSSNEAADLDGDGDLDFAVANILDHDVSVLVGNGDGTFQPHVRHDVGGEPRGLAVLDADGDGDADLVTANRISSDLSLLRNAGDGSFASEARFQGGLNRETSVVAADMDRDGALDLVVVGYSSHDGNVLRGDGLGGFTPLVPRALGSNPWMVAAGDVNADGFHDVAAACSSVSRAALSFGDGAGGLGPATTYVTGSFPIAIELGDLNGDGLLDLVASSYGADFDLYRNQGGGVMGGHTTLPAPSAASCVALHDRDGDGDVDVTGVDELADRVLLFRQD